MPDAPDPRPVDTHRIEGAYVVVTHRRYPAGGGADALLFEIEHVNGNCRVDKIGVTEDEAYVVINSLLYGLGREIIIARSGVELGIRETIVSR